MGVSLQELLLLLLQAAEAKPVRVLHSRNVLRFMLVQVGVKCRVTCRLLLLLLLLVAQCLLRLIVLAVREGVAGGANQR